MGWEADFGGFTNALCSDVKFGRVFRTGRGIWIVCVCGGRRVCVCVVCVFRFRYMWGKRGRAHGLFVCLSVCLSRSSESMLCVREGVIE